MKYADKVMLGALLVVVAFTALTALASWAVVSFFGDSVSSNLFVILATANGFYLFRELATEAADDMIKRKRK